MKKLANKVALFTGATSGIGKAVSQAFIQHGMTVIGADRRDVLLKVNIFSTPAYGHLRR